MKNYYLKKTLLMLFLFCGEALFSQNQYWEKTTTSRFSETEILQRNSVPNSFKVFHLNMDKFSEILDLAPLRSPNTIRSSVVVEFPMPNGTFQRFTITESPIMHPILAAKFPQIKTYKAIGIDDPTATMRFSITQFGLHVMKLSGLDGATFIDPYTTNRENYIVYSKSSLGADYGNFECLTDYDINITSLGSNYNLDRADTADQKLRTYRLALSSVGEYSSIFAGSGTDAEKKANVQAQMTITMNRVNEIYERDLAITMQFVPNNDAIIFLDAATDPWSWEWNNTTQTVIDNAIGSANYDIGHNFNTSGGGNAGCIACVCTDGQKGSAYTGRSNPTGDAFDIDYVAHEMGHQFGGYHTMNTCSRSGNGVTEVEPASGSSIMGYAGICSTNVQPNSDAHFNYVNIRDIADNIQTGNSSSCDVETSLTNQPPVADAGPDYTIPKSTAFVLRGSATDPDGLATLTYNWSQNDPEQGAGNAAPQSSWVVGPLYRSRLPISSPNRSMPQMSDVVANNLTPTWEVTPSVARQMSFSFTVRDNGSGFANGIGQTSSDLMEVTVVDEDPFVMTSPNTAVTWNVASTEMVTWDVGQTNNSTINCQTVNIKLSTDGGMTYPIVLASGTPNDGSESISIPDYQTTTARVMVEAADNIFYDISNTNFTIGAPNSPTFTISVPAAQTSQVLCAPSNSVVDVSYQVFLGFNEVTTFSASGVPSGVSVNFSTNNINSSQTVVATISPTNSISPGIYPITINAQSSSVQRSQVIEFEVYSTNLTPLNLTFPAQNATGVPLSTALNWDADSNASSYVIQLANDTSFSTNLMTYISTTNSYDLNNLQTLSLYYWRVAPKNPCGQGAFSSTSSFTTASVACNGANSTQNNLTFLPFSTGGADIVRTSTMNVGTDTVISDINVAINVQHSLSADIELKLTSPSGTTITLLNSNTCPAGGDIAVTFDDQGSALSCSSSAPAVSGTVMPFQALSAFNGESPLGDWTLTITDTAPSLNGGEFLNFSLDICGVPLGLSKQSLDDFVVVPNPSAGQFDFKLPTGFNADVKVLVHDLHGRAIYNKVFTNQPQRFHTIILDAVSQGMYFLNVSDGVRTAIKRIIIK
jgi:subtilisin-like proprotein convertase family protein